MNPLVSVIIPTYKRSEMLPRAIDSVLTQTYKNVQVIVVDDNDPNTEYRKCTENRMNQYSNDKRVIYVKHQRNRNGAAARNSGLKVCSGKYVCFLDDDDFFFKKKCEKQVFFLESNLDYSACCCDYLKNGNSSSLPAKENYTEDILLLSKTPQTSGIMFRKKSIEEICGFNESYIRHQDYELLLRFFQKNRIYKINETLYERGSSEISNIPKGNSFLQVKMKFLSDFDDLILKIDSKKKGFKRTIYSIHYERIAKNYLKGHFFVQSLIYAFKSFYLNPFQFCKMLTREIQHTSESFKGN